MRSGWELLLQSHASDSRVVHNLAALGLLQQWIFHKLSVRQIAGAGRQPGETGIVPPTRPRSHTLLDTCGCVLLGLLATLCKDEQCIRMWSVTVPHSEDAETAITEQV